MFENLKSKVERRGFIGALVGSAGALGLAAISGPVKVLAQQKTKTLQAPHPADVWFDKVKGRKHSVVYDATRPHEVMPFAWPRVFLLTNAATGSPETDCGVVVVLRHDAICYAFDDRVWSDYKFGEMFKADDPDTKSPSLRNPFWKPKPGAFKIPGFGEVAIGIDQLQQSGVMFCVCDAAMTVFSAVAGQSSGKEGSVIKADWMKSLLPGIQVVPSGVWALGRAQEHGCKYIFAG